MSVGPGRGGVLPQGSIRPDLVFLDVESSGLRPGSFPVEVGLSDDALASRSWKIRPLPAWTSWDPAAEALHGLSRDGLGRDGLEVSAVARELALAVGGRVAVSDAPDWDGEWLDLLYAAAGSARPFALVGIEAAVLCPGPDEPPGEALERAAAWAQGLAVAGGRFPHIHRAGDDARGLAAAWRAAADPAFLLALLTAPVDLRAPDGHCPSRSKERKACPTSSP
jgi:hypothetical protein